MSTTQTGRPAVDTVNNAGATPDVRAALGRARPQARRVRADPRDPRPPPDQRRARDVLGHVERALLLQVEQGPPPAVRREDHRRDAREAARRHRRERRRRRHRRRLGGHLQGRVAQPPVATSSPTRARPPASAASSATSSRWAPARSRSWTRCASAPLDHPDTQRVLPGVVAGVGGYGNCLGLPNIGGEVVFDACYQGNPLVNALCVGVDAARGHPPRQGVRRRQQGRPLRRQDRRRRHRRRLVLASETFDDGGPTKRPAVQVGDPFAEKVLIECCLELFAARPRRRHPGPRRRRPLLRHQRAGLQRRRRHARRARPRAAARRHAARPRRSS